MTRPAHRFGLAAVILSAAVAGLSGPAAAQSFECGDASLRSERAVCGSDRLSGLDDRMSRLYDKLMASIDSNRGRERVREYQRHFLAARDACGRDVSCIKGAYLDQIEVLSARIRVAQSEGD
jgi:uncharacterized protein